MSVRNRWTPEPPSTSDPFALESHAAAALFPLMDGAELRALVDDINENGLRHPIVLLDGKVLDGRNRLRACELSDTQPSFVQFDGVDAIAFVVSCNLRRRHLSESQRAMVARRIKGLTESREREDDEASVEPRPHDVDRSDVPTGEATERTEAGFSDGANLPRGDGGRFASGAITGQRAADLLNVSERSVKHAGRVLEHGAPELVEAVDRGDVAVSTAATLAELPAEEQAEVVARGEKEILERAKEIKRRKRAERIPNDAYYTPDLVALACVQAIGLVVGKSHPRVLEPSVGGGAFARAVRSEWRAHVDGVDINDEAPGFEDCDDHTVADFAAYSAPEDVRYDWVLGNPPYVAAEEHVRHALSLAPAGGVAFLLRLGFLEGQDRIAFWKQFPPSEVIALAKRPSFTGGGSDQTAYAWFIWRTGFSSAPTIGWIR